MRKRNPKTAVDAFISQQPRDALARERKSIRLEQWFTDDFAIGEDCLKVPCLKCGHRVATKRIDRGSAASQYFIRCKACGPVSKNFESREEAVKAWNGEACA